jgi:hypothetical protein
MIVTANCRHQFHVSFRDWRCERRGVEAADRRKDGRPCYILIANRTLQGSSRLEQFILGIENVKHGSRAATDRFFANAVGGIHVGRHGGLRRNDRGTC